MRPFNLPKLAPLQQGRSTRIALWLLIASLALLVLPMPTLQSLYLQQWAQDNGFIIGLAALLSASYLVADNLQWLLSKVGAKQRQQERLQLLERKVALLDTQERAVLREFFLQASSTVRMPHNHPAVAELYNAGVLEQLGEVEHYAIEGPVAQMRLSSDAKPLLNRQLLRLPEANMTEEQRAQLLAARPDFVATLNRNRRR